MFKRFLVFVLVAGLVFPYSAFADVIGEFAVVTGDVTVTRNGQAIKPNVKDTIQTNDVIATGENSNARVVLTDDTAMALGSGTKLEMKQFTVQDGKTTGLFSLPAGLVQTNIGKALSPDSKFDIHTPNAIVGAKGTAWLTLVQLAAYQSPVNSSVYTLQNAVSVTQAALPAQYVSVVAGNFSVVAGAALPTQVGAFQTGVVAGLTSQLGPSAIPGIFGTPAIPGIAGVGAAPFAAGAGTAGLAGGSNIMAGIGGGALGAGLAITAGATAAIIAASTGKGTTMHHSSSHHQ